MEPVETVPIETTAESSSSSPPADAAATTTESTVTHRNISEWHGRDLVDRYQLNYAPLDTESGRRLARR